MAPQKSVVVGGIPEDARVEALVERGRQIAVYVHGGKQADLVVDLPEGMYRAAWLDTKSGRTVARQAFHHAGGPATLHSPEYSEDIALSVRASR
jgi:hypothetical protein